ncbi:MAG TPA: hypothetical protein VJW76_16820, partial [Verrucomicrobiae bacterium]|nr:hypothetical protein [Verrucomicrobiae bacterium]
MGNPHEFDAVHWDHEPSGTLSERGCVEDQPQHWESSGLLRLIEDDTAALRFMESSLFLADLLTGHEPDRLCRVRRWKQCGRCRPLEPCARWKDWFR